MWFFLQDLVYYLRFISKSPQHYRKLRLQWTPLHKILNRNIIINHFQNWIFDAKIRLLKIFFQKYKLLIKTSNLVRFYFTSKYFRDENLVPRAFEIA